MFEALGVAVNLHADPDLFYFLSREDVAAGSGLGGIARSLRHRLRCRSLAAEARRSDLIVLIAPFPTAYRKDRFCEIERTIRRTAPNVPVVNSSNYFLLTKGPYLNYLRDGAPDRDIPEPGNFGLERYDWYLSTSIASPNPLPRIDNPCSVVGVNLDDGTLYPEKKDRFVALIDFERPECMHERRIQVQALEETDTEYIVLHGNYPVDRIREIYRRCSLYFLASPESFGLPICEVQACGGFVFTPHPTWCSGHWIKDDPHEPGPGRLSPNFVVYDDDLEKLKSEIRRAKESHDPEQVRNTFLEHQPQLYYGDLDALKGFVDRVAAGAITGTSHLEYTKYNDLAEQYGSPVHR
jgi:hypothetical protein